MDLAVEEGVGASDSEDVEVVLEVEDAGEVSTCARRLLSFRWHCIGVNSELYLCVSVCVCGAYYGSGIV